VEPVILLMFGVGMHFSIRDLWAVRGIALPGAVAQIAATTAMGVGVGVLWGWTLGAGVVFGSQATRCHARADQADAGEGQARETRPGRARRRNAETLTSPLSAPTNW
jgi:Sodium/hydrogen exchanger family